ncbi:helix-turn-helix domain-containing protein [Bacteroides sp. UBA939]|uniref:helix-turn-helix domain-containing protein n=1 Tax=Bacteroides sp. UBA939 TaxID=1946092 RepID=UPI0025C26943|nr:AraC family transcriptional regulator [Bacteroides sp. UBA939]
MTNRQDIYVSLIYEIQAAVSIICVVVMVMYLLSRRPKPVTLVRSLIFAYCMSGLGWICMMLYIISPHVFVILQSFFYFGFFIWHVIFYRIIFFLTGTGREEKFSRWHYLLPVLIPFVLFVWSFFVPMDSQIYIVESRGELAPGYEAYSVLFLSKAAGIFVWNIVYAMLSLRRIVAYNRVAPDYLADEGRSSTRWMMQIFWLKISVITLPLIDFIFGKTVLMGSLIIIVPCVLIIVQLILLCYNIVAENYTVIPLPRPEEEHAEKIRKIRRARFEKYMSTHKPYLNAKLHIADVAVDLNTNRTYLSNFINREYGMNFSRWINRQRLQELERIRLDPACRDLSGMELVIQAGFSNYRAYARVKKAEDKLTTLGE